MPSLLPASAVAVVLAVTLHGQPASAQVARRSVEVSVTVVEPPQVRLEPEAAAVRDAGGGLELSIPLRTSGGGSPTVSVRQGSTERECEVVPTAAASPATGRGAWLRCFIPGTAATAGGVIPVPVTLLIVPAT